MQAQRCGSTAERDPLHNIRVVLHQPRGAMNVGAVARAIANMGLGELLVVRTQPLRQQWLRTMAVHAERVVDSMRQTRTLAEAVGDCAVVVGTTCRAGGYRQGTLPPRALAPEIVARARQQPVALVFGPEDRGLSNSELRLCHQLIAIPTAAEYTSLNLAQAVMICAYELRLAAHDHTLSALGALAPAARVEQVYERLRAAFLSIGFLHRDNPEHIMFALRRLLGRTGLTEREVRILLGLARQIEWFGNDGWKSLRAKARAQAEV